MQRVSFMNFTKKKIMSLLISYSSYCMGHTSWVLWVINEQTMGSWEGYGLRGAAGRNK